MYLRTVEIKERVIRNKWVLCVKCLVSWATTMAGMGKWAYMVIERGPCDCCGKYVR